jgi:AsmA-like C-terminal region
MSRNMLLALAAVIVISTGVLGSLRWPVAADGMRARLDTAIAHETGYNLASLNSASFSAFPWPNILATGLELVRKDGSGERAVVPFLKARISLSSWVMGAPRVTSLGLRDPVVYLPSADQASGTEAVTSTLFKVLRADSSARLKSVRVHNGSVVVAGETFVSHLHLVASDVATSDFRVFAKGEYRRVPVRVTAEFGKSSPDVRRPVNWQIASELGDVAFNGMLLGPRTLDAEGQLRLRVAPVEKWEKMLGHTPAMMAVFGGTALVGHARVMGSLVQVQAATIARDEQILTGSIAFSLASGLPQVSATLDVDRLDISGLLPAASALLTDEKGGWSTRPLPEDWLYAGRIDLRLSARKLVIGAYGIDQAAASIHMGPGRVEAMLSEGRVGRGSIKGRAVVSRSGEGFELRCTGSVDRLDTSAALAPHGIDRVKGAANGTFSFESTGHSIAALVARSEGRASLLMRDGEVAGIDLDRLLTRMERGATVAPMALEGRTRFQSLSVQITLRRGLAELSDSQLATEIARAPLTGSINLSARGIDLIARLKAADGSDPRSGDFTLRAQGPWGAPSVSPDIRPRGGRS